MTEEIIDGRQADRIIFCARALFDNRLGWGRGGRPYAPREIWADLGAALYGDDDPAVVELRTPHVNSTCSAGYGYDELSGDLADDGEAE